MKAEFFYTDVFTETAFQGNPLAVFPNADGMEDDLMQHLAREIGFSETVFILPAADPECLFRLRIFTPTKELPFAGHPTLGAAFVLHHLGGFSGNVVRFEEGVGPIDVFQANSYFTMVQPPPRPGPIWERADLLARLVGLSEPELDHDRDSQVWGSGLDFLYITLKSRQALREAKVNLSVLHEALNQVPLPPLYLVYPETDTVHSRMFAPQLGVMEDPATGSAAGPLCAYLGASGQCDLDDQGWVRVTVLQGEDMGRPSLIKAAAPYRGNTWGSPEVGGRCVLVASGQFWV